MGNRIVLLVPYENAKEDYEDRVAIVTRARNMVHKFETGSTVCSAVESEESKNLEA
mgnify:CR=1 FL=1